MDGEITSLEGVGYYIKSLNIVKLKVDFIDIKNVTFIN